MRKAVITLILCGFAIGCGGSDSKAPPEPVFPVTGVISFNGAPVVGADVTFLSADGGDRSAFGRTNDAGEYQLTTFSANDGAVPGRYVVTITKIASTAPEVPAADVESEAYDPPGVGESTSPAEPAKSELPERYADQTTSGLTAMVQEIESNSIDFTL
jgi:hypothetical protein